ncbi:MAG: glutathione S-transferase family protein [Gammaproteobacteria bacterium]|nr:glutathione S-transferase family protein [Gammaproteobacteria bacterium]
MKLYMVPLAPNPTKVMLYIAERGELGTEMGIEQIVVNTVKGRHREPEHLARNPFGTLPVLELDDGSYFVESLAIIAYLEDKFPDGALLDGSPEARARARDVERIVDLRVAGPMGAYGHAKNSPLGRPPDPEKAAQMEASVQAPLDYLEGLLDDGRPLLLGERVSIADCTLAAPLQFLRFVEADLFGDRPLLRAWDERYRARPAAQSVLRW